MRTRRGQGAHNDTSMAGPSKQAPKLSRGVQKPKPRKPPAPKKAAAAKKKVPVKRRAAAPPKAAAARRAAKPAAAKPKPVKVAAAKPKPAKAATIDSLPNQTLCQIFGLLSSHEPEYCRCDLVHGQAAASPRTAQKARGRQGCQGLLGEPCAACCCFLAARREVLPLVCSRFRDVLAQPSAVWDEVKIDFALKGWDFESGSPKLSADAPACIMRTAVERWIQPRAAAVRSLIVT